MSSESQVAADARVQIALQHLQEARRQVELAGQALSPVCGLGKEWQALLSHTEKLRSMWYRVRRRRDTARAQGVLELDDDSILEARP